MEAEIGLCLVAWMAATQMEGLTGFAGPLTSDAVASLHEHWSGVSRHLLAAAAAAIDGTHALVLESIVVYTAICAPRQHMLPTFSAESIIGKDGAWRPSLLNPTAYPLGETTSTAGILYGLAFGLNLNLLTPRTEYLAAVAQAWSFLATTALQGKHALAPKSPSLHRSPSSPT